MKYGKVTLHFKTPDVDMQIDESDEEDKPTKEMIMKKLSKWLKWSECVNIEFDLDNETAKVLAN